MKALAVLVLAGLLLPAMVAAEQISTESYNSIYANATIASTYGYIDSVNQSGYLVFQPNLTLAYKYAWLALGNVSSDPNLSVFYSEKARGIAQQQYSQISQYKSESIGVMALVTLALLMALLKVMAPVVSRRSNKKQTGN